MSMSKNYGNLWLPLAYICMYMYERFSVKAKFFSFLAINKAENTAVRVRHADHVAPSQQTLALT
jgi:hypothetical protein